MYACCTLVISLLIVDIHIDNHIAIWPISVEACRDNVKLVLMITSIIIIRSYFYTFVGRTNYIPCTAQKSPSHQSCYVGHLVSRKLQSLFNVRSSAMIPPAVSLGTAISWSSEEIFRPSLLFWISL